MRIYLCILSTLLLCSCAGTPTLHSSVNGNSYTSGPTSADDPRMLSPQFYMDDDKSPVQPSGTSQTPQLRAVDNFCTATCQANRNSVEYCNRACGI
jgi:hypothetical protein